MKFSPDKKLLVTKASGKKMIFFPGKLKHSLKRSGADEATTKQILDIVLADAYDGISTQEIYQQAFRLLKQNSRHHAARYKLKHAIMELGPTGYPFEVFVGKIFEQLLYKVRTGQIIKGECVKHEVDVIAAKGNLLVFAECKFHNRPGVKCDVKIPLYVHSRFRDIESHYQKQPETNSKIHQGWLVTNTHFTDDTVRYGECVGLQLLGWDYPVGNGLKEIIDRMGLHPITCLTTLRNAEKQILLDKNIVLSNQILNDLHLLKTLRIDDKRTSEVKKEIEGLCTPVIASKKN
jgi:hypothetical protein